MTGRTGTGIKGVVFDVNETLSDMAPMAEAFEAVGAPGWFGKLWFTTVLRDGFALSTTRDRATFAVIAEEQLRNVLQAVPLSTPLEDAIGSILERLNNLSLHPDVAKGVRALKRSGFSVLTLSNGSSDLAARLISAGGLDDQFSHLLSVEGTSDWKPAEQAYRVATEATGFELADLLLVAVHPWDIHGASRAGMPTAWINRNDEVYPTYFTAPDIAARSASDLHDII